MTARTRKTSHSTANDQTRLNVYQIIEEIITEHTNSRQLYISRDDIATRLVNHPKAHQIVLNSLKKDHHNEQSTWEKAANYVDWLNADITVVNPYSSKWNDGFYARKRLKNHHPFTGKLREVWFIALQNPTLNDDIQEIITRRGITDTERLQLLKARIGQGDFRAKLIDYWKGCSITGCTEIGLLRASHIKPWKDANNPERLDAFNGLLLIPNLDAAFDKGYISFGLEGEILISPCLSKEDMITLGIHHAMGIDLDKRHQVYMQYHRDNIYKK